MIAELISIGDELLIGQTINTNAAYIAQQMTAIGVAVKWVTVVSDTEQDILDALQIASGRAQIVIATGGLGPTHDDVTRNAFVKYFDTKLVLDKNVLKHIEGLFARRKKQMPASNRDQAMIPADASIIPNDFGTAPGFQFTKKDRIFIVLPGVPLEMKTMMDKYVIPSLRKMAHSFIHYTMIKTTGISESALFELMGDINKLERDVKIAFLPRPTGVEVRITAQDSDERACLQRLENARQIVLSRIGNYVWGQDEQQLEDIVAQLLLTQHKKLAVVESSTGGLVAHWLTDQSNHQAYLQAVVVIPTMEQVMDFIAMDDKHYQSGISGREMAEQMALAVLRKYHADVALATAPLFKGENNSPGFDAFVAVVTQAGTHVSSTFVNRDVVFNKERPAQLALDLLRRALV